MRAFKAKILKTNDSLNQAPTLGYQQLQVEFQKACKKMDQPEYDLPIAVKTCQDFDVILTKFRLEYETFTEIYNRLLQSDYDETSAGATVDHIEISNALMEKFSLLVEAQDDMKQLLK